MSWIQFEFSRPHSPSCRSSKTSRHQRQLIRPWVDQRVLTAPRDVQIFVCKDLIAYGLLRNTVRASIQPVLGGFKWFGPVVAVVLFRPVNHIHAAGAHMSAGEAITERNRIWIGVYL